MEILQMIVQQVAARKPLTRATRVSFAFICDRSISSIISAVFNATSKELKRHLSFKLFKGVMVRRLLKLPI
jgi:hypothetical protein